MKKQLLSLSIFIIALILSSCVKDHFSVNKKFSGDVAWNPDLAVPLAQAKLTLRDMLKERHDTLEYVNEKELGNLYDTKGDSVLVVRFGIDTVQVVNMLNLPKMPEYDTTLYLKPVEISTADLKLPIAEKITDIISNANNEYTLDGGNEALSDIFEYVYITEGSMSLTCYNTSSEPINCDIELVVDSAGVRKPIGTFSFTGIPPIEINSLADLQAITDYIDNGGELPAVLKQASLTTTKELENQYIGQKLYYTYKNFSPLDAALFNPAQSLISVVEFSDLQISSGKAQVPQQTIAADTTMYVSVGTDKSKQRLFEVDVDRGEINYTIKSEIDIATHFIFTFPTVKDEFGVAAKFEDDIQPNTTVTGTLDLANYNIDLTKMKDGTTGYNSLPIELAYKVQAGGMTTFGGDQKIDLTISNQDSIHFKFLRGNIGSGTEEIVKEKIDFNISEVLDIFDGDITFEDPRLSFQFENPIAAPAAIDLNLSASNDKGETVQMFSEGTRRFDIGAPDCDGVQQNSQVPTLITFNRNTTNIVNLLGIMPNTIEYSGNLHYNPDDENAENENCISNSAQVGLAINVDVPLNVTFKGVKLSTDVEMNPMDGVESFDELAINLRTKNQFPVDVYLDIIMLDTTLAEGNQILGSLAEQQLLTAAKPDAKGKVSREAEIEEIKLPVIVNAETLDAFTKANKIRIEVKLASANEKAIVFYSYYSIDVQISANGKILIHDRL